MLEKHLNGLKNKKMKAKKIIFGLGTGRCGTMSLSHLLSFQKNANITHELGGKPYLPWEKDMDKFSLFIKEIQNRSDVFIGDVSFYCLPYWEDIVNMGYDCYFIILKRDKEATIESYLKKTQGQNPFSVHDGTVWSYYDWDKCYPKFTSSSKKEAIEKYYDFYYEKCLQIPQEMCFWLKTEELNNFDKSIEMLKFCGFETPLHKNFISNQKA